VRNMSFSHTTEQMRARTKTVTRRIGWLGLKPGDLLQAVEKAMGLGKGGKVRRLGVIRVLTVRRERLDELVRPGSYGAEEMVKEGFPELDPQDFMLRYFVEKIEPNELITRIEFEHVAGSGETVSRTALNPAAAWPFPT